jgi:hypothetical protein
VSEPIETTRDIDTLSPHPRNYNQHPPAQIARIAKSLVQFGQVRPIVVHRDTIIAGHGVHMAAAALAAPVVNEAMLRGYVFDDTTHTYERWCEYKHGTFQTLRVTQLPDDWTDEQAMAYLVADNETRRGAEPNDTELAALLDELQQADFDLDSLGFDEAEYGALLDGLTPELPEPGSGGDEFEPDDAAPCRVQPGDVWLIGGVHRLICGDCTDPVTVERLMQGERVVLCHADPPYGMGKEGEGIANDNLYREELDAFQMQWWRVARCFLEDNASGYIWGNAQDLWRLWYVGGLRDSERLTLRNEVVWDKGVVQGMGSNTLRSYPPTSERCLFFMIGEQGFNNNADNYWEGWETIRAYLAQERDRMGWSDKVVADMFGFHPRMASHWFSKSQWSFMGSEQYQKLQNAAQGRAFLREYDDLKREFYATRAYFDNTHTDMADVWRFPRVQGLERYGHATPKPVEMIARILQSSAPEASLVYDPFLGSGTTIIAAHRTGRRCYGCEISPEYCEVILQRCEAEGLTVEKVEA